MVSSSSYKTSYTLFCRILRGPMILIRKYMSISVSQDKISWTLLQMDSTFTWFDGLDVLFYYRCHSITVLLIVWYRRPRRNRSFPAVCHKIYGTFYLILPTWPIVIPCCALSDYLPNITFFSKTTRTIERLLLISAMKQASLRSKNKFWLALNQDNVSDWSDMSTWQLLFQWVL